MKKFREGGFLISKIKQISGRIFDRKLKEYKIEDLNTAQGRIIFSLWQNDHISIGQLAQKTGLGKTSLTSMLDRLEKRGYITRKADRKDKRKLVVSLTEKIRAVEGPYEAVSEEMTDIFYEGLSDEQIDAFENSLKHILSNLVRFEQETKGE